MIDAQQILSYTPFIWSKTNDNFCSGNIFGSFRLGRAVVVNYILTWKNANIPLFKISSGAANLSGK